MNIHIVFWIKDGVLYWRTSNSHSNSQPLHGRDVMPLIKTIVAEFSSRWPETTWELI